VSATVTSLTGWIQVPLFGVLVAIPFFLHGKLSGAGARRGSFLVRMRPHYWLGFAVAGLTLTHAFAPMSSGLMRGANVTGLDLTSGALFLVLIQVFLGVNLRNPKLSNRRVVRRWHFWIMAVFAVLGIGHVWLNSGLVQSIHV
jgi:hypothetical protein